MATNNADGTQNLDLKETIKHIEREKTKDKTKIKTDVTKAEQSIWKHRSTLSFSNADLTAKDPNWHERIFGKKDKATK